MMDVRVVNKTRGTVLGREVDVANRWWERLRGLMGRKPETDEGLLLVPCQCIHTYGVFCPLDVAFLDRSGRVVTTYHRLQPGERTEWEGEATYALELPAGTLAATGTRTGDHVAWRPNQASEQGDLQPQERRNER